MVLSALMFLAVIAAIQYGYHHGPAWLYRCENNDPAFFPIASGVMALCAAIGGFIYAIDCILTEPKDSLTLNRVVGTVWLDGADKSLNEIQVESGHATREKREELKK